MVPHTKRSWIATILLAIIPCLIVVPILNISYALSRLGKPYSFFDTDRGLFFVEIGIWLFAYMFGLAIVRLFALWRRRRIMRRRMRVLFAHQA